MFAEPGETVLLFPAQTRYEQRGGGTITSTERRIRFSPEIPGPRIGEARSEWEIIQSMAQQILPAEKQKLLNFQRASEIRREIDDAIPLYKGIRNLKREKDSFQYGGARILNDGICPNLPDERARFSVLSPQNDVLKPGEFYLTTRRGKQFNSIIYGKEDPLIGSRTRDEIYLCPADAESLNLKEGDRIVLNSETGEYAGVCRIGPLHPRTVQVFWPEANVLISRRIDPASHEPDYNTIVTVREG